MTRSKSLWPRLLAAAVFLGGFLLFASTLAPSVVFGDPSEYTFVPHIWGVLHPPGYAFMTLLVKTWQTLAPVGSVAYRTNLLSAVIGALSGVLVFGGVHQLSPLARRASPRARLMAAGFAALALFASTDFWQHAIHANAHIVTAALAALSLFLLLAWRAGGDHRRLSLFAFVAGLSVTQHPLLVFSFPAYAAFIVAVDRQILRNWRRLLALAAFGLAGLFPWLYFPIRSSLAPPTPFGPDNLNTLSGFLSLVLAQGLRVNLFHFGLAQQWQRLIVFWSILRLQFWLPPLLMIGLALLWLVRRDRPVALLFALYLGVNLAFIMNSVQDVMAYFLVPLAGMAMLAGIGATAFLEWAPWLAALLTPPSDSPEGQPVTDAPTPGTWNRRPGDEIILGGAVLLVPSLAIFLNSFGVSLRHERAADAYADAVYARFEGRREGAILLSDWEHLTPLWYRQYVEGRRLDPADVRPVFVSGGARPWADAVRAHLGQGPVYVIDYFPEIAAEGFRLQADGAFYRVTPPPAAVGEIPNRLDLQFGPLRVLGYDLGPASVAAGDTVRFALIMQLLEPTDHVLSPVVDLGPYRYAFTTDSHLLTPEWQRDEQIAQRWDLTVPVKSPTRDYPLSLGIADLTTGQSLPLPTGEITATIGRLHVEGLADVPNLVMAADFGQRTALQEGLACLGWRCRAIPWPEPFEARPGDRLHLLLRWRALRPNETSYVVFLHLLDEEYNLWAGQDYTPLGGAFPTMLWFPKWVVGQEVTDPYTLNIPADAPPGMYFVEVGFYGLRTVQRVPVFDADGDLAGDSVRLGAVTVSP